MIAAEEGLGQAFAFCPACRWRGPTYRVDGCVELAAADDAEHYAEAHRAD